MAHEREAKPSIEYLSSLCYYSDYKNRSNIMSKIKGITVEKLRVRDPRFGTTFKVLFGESKERTISFLNAVYSFTGDDAIIKVDIEFTNVVDAEIKGFGRSVIFDVKCYDRAGRYFIISMQKGNHEGYFERAVYYGDRQLVSAANTMWQDNKEQYDNDVKVKGKTNSINKNDITEFYKNIPQVRVLSILDYIQFENYDDYASSYHITRKKDGSAGTDIISWDLIELPKFCVQEPELKTTMDRWLYLLNRRDDEVIELTDNILGNDPGITSAYKRLSMLSKEELSSLERDIKSFLDGQSYVATQINKAVERIQEETKQIQEERKQKLQEEIKQIQEETKQVQEERKQAEQKLQEEIKQRKQKLQEEIKQGKQQMVRNMLALDMDITSIEQIMGLSRSEITALKEQSSKIISN